MNFMNKRLLLCLTLVLNSSIFAQKTQTIKDTTINGIKYYVYPFNIHVDMNSRYYDFIVKDINALKDDEAFAAEISSSGKSLKELKKEYRKYQKSYRKYNNREEDKIYRSAAFKKAVRKNPYPMLNVSYTLEKDIIPSLDPLPNGAYVQFFDDYMLLEENGKVKQVKKQIAGFFELKDNKLNANAVWFGIEGDTLKTGLFVDGLKEGTWMCMKKGSSFYYSKTEIQRYIKEGNPSVKFVKTIVDYKHGIQNGKYLKYETSVHPTEEGMMKDGLPAGEWIKREIEYTNRHKVFNNEKITSRYTLAEKPMLSHRPMIRYHIIPNMDYSYDLPGDFMFEEAPYIDFRSFTTKKEDFENKENIELEEEMINSYEGEVYEGDYGDEHYYEEDYYENEVLYYREVYDEKLDRYIAFNKIIDSIGVYYNYIGVYENYYTNGQLMCHFEFDEQGLVEEDTIFWDNGKPLDVITYDKDSAQYIQRIYDYAGTLYKELAFNDKKEFIRVNYEIDESIIDTLDGLIAKLEYKYDNYYAYNKVDTLEHELKEKTIIYKSWTSNNKMPSYEAIYYPQNDRLLQVKSYAVNGNVFLENLINYSSDFSSYNGTKLMSLDRISIKTNTSASIFTDGVYYKKMFDSLPQTAVYQYDNWYDESNEYLLQVDNQPFTGKANFKINPNQLKWSVSKNKVSFLMPYTADMSSKSKKSLEDLILKGKNKTKQLFYVIDEMQIDESVGSDVFDQIFNENFQQWLEMPYAYEYEYGEYGKSTKRNKNANPSLSHIKGQYVNGKPEGKWLVYNTKGDLEIELNFLNGLLHGQVKKYDYKRPNSYNYNLAIYDTFPAKTKYHLSEVLHYKNGLLHGDTYEYNWVGEIVMKKTYVDGFEEGKSFERNKIAHTDMTYQNGALHGFLTTKLTLPGRDSLKIYELNFRNGLLQGESKAFHVNGNLAKRGFFMDGRPIDDYEAYDTLGFKYHYVKFQYSYPIEEKIWEENQLSVRYQFAWQDSIYFRPNDITSSQSLDALVYNLGLDNENLYRPYYGRKSIINKEGIKYQMTKYYPNDTIARDGEISSGKKVGCWKYYDYYGKLLYEVDYADSILTINDSVQFKSKGILIDFDDQGKKISESFVIEKFEKYDCSHTDHYEIRQLMTIWDGNDSLDLMNGYVKNYYDNGVLQNEGMMKNGLPTGVWKFYDPYGKLNQVGEYVLGKRNGRWLGGDLSKTKYLGDICLNPNLPNLEEEIKYRENLLDIVITNYKMGKAMNKEFYDVNMNDEMSDGEEVIIDSEIIEE